MLTLLVTLITAALAQDVPQTKHEMIERGCEDAKVYAKTVEACWRSFNTARIVADEEVQKMRFKKPISYSLVCRDGWISSCGCDGGRGCCSHHGGIGGCDVQYIDAYKYPDGHWTPYAPVSPFLEAIDLYVPNICMSIKPPWPWRGISVKSNPRTSKVTKVTVLPMQLGMPWSAPLITTSEQGLRYQLPALSSPEIKRFIPKGVHIGIDPDYVMGWEMCAL